RDALELSLLERFIPQGTPVLGICRGAQLINVHLGGTLDPDIYTTHAGLSRRRTVLPRKTVGLAAASQLNRIIKATCGRSNSRPHQAVEKPGEGAALAARDRNGLVQATASPRHDFLIGVQWHPEWLVFKRPQQRLIRALVRAASSAAPSAQYGTGL